MARAPIAIVASFNVVFVISQFFRSAVAVIAPDMMIELDLGPTAIGLVGGAFFVAIAAMQIPVGILLDRFGPRRTTPALLVLAVAGAVVFASAEGTAGLVAGQALIGAGCAGVFMGGMVAIARWYPPERFATVSGIMLAISVGGMLLSATPLAWAADAFGWRAAFLFIAALTAVLGLVMYAVVRDAPAGHDFHRRNPESLGAALAGLRSVIADRDMPFLLAIAFVAYASVFAVRGLWGGPYLADIHGLGAVDRGNVLLLLSLGTMIGLLVYGPLERHAGGRRIPVLGGAFVGALCLFTLALVPGPSTALVASVLFVLGVSGAYVVLLLAHGRSLVPDHLVGRAVTTVNFANFVGVGVIQVATGIVVAAFPETAGHPPEAAYRTVFGMIGGLLVVAALLYGRVRDHGRP